MKYQIKQNGIVTDYTDNPDKFFELLVDYSNKSFKKNSLYSRCWFIPTCFPESNRIDLVVSKDEDSIIHFIISKNV